MTPPESHALIAGQVIEAAERRNAVTGQPFWWALIDTVGGTFDVVIDPSLLSSQQVHTGYVIAGWFWLSGRLLQATPRAGWLHKLTRRR